MAKRNWIKLASLSAVSLGALAAGCIDGVFAQSSNLPPVTIDAPNRQQVRRTAPPRRASVSRNTARRAVQPVPVRPVVSSYPTPSKSQVNAPPAPFAGGQVASGTQIGLLGNRNIFDTPFSVAGYTKDLVQSIQARTVSDILERDPAITVAAPGAYYDLFAIRGFPASTNDLALNGLFGVAPSTTFPLELFDRVEVLRGPAQLLYGYPPTGSLGGVVNLVPKHATDTPIAQITGTYWSQGMGGTAIDIGKRFGEFNEWGIRTNVLYRNGRGAFDNYNEERGAASVGLDYRGERLRASFDYFHNSSEERGLRTPFGLLPGVAVPTGVRNTSNFAQPYEFYRKNHDFGVGRVEADVFENVTVFAAAGGSKQNDVLVQSLGNTVIDNAGTLTQFLVGGPFQLVTKSAEIGVRADFQTGPIRHKVVASTQELLFDRNTALTFGFALTNIYNPTPFPNPGVSENAGPLNPVTRLDARSVSVADTLSVLNERVALTVGARFQDLKQDNFSFITGAKTDTQQGERTSPAVGLLVKPVENVSLYANYIEALTLPATAPAGTANFGQGFAPVVTQQKEVGIKINWWGTLGTTFAAYDITSPSVLTNAVTNTFGPIGLQRNRGLEFTVFGEPIKGLRALAGISFIDGRLENTPDPTTIGKKAPGVPDFQGSAGVDIDIPYVRGLTVSPLAVYVGNSFYDPQNTQHVPGYVRFDLGASYTFENVWLSGKPIVVRGRIVNVFSANYLTNVTGLGGGLLIGSPRSFMLSATFNF